MKNDLRSFFVSHGFFRDRPPFRRASKASGDILYFRFFRRSIANALRFAEESLLPFFFQKIRVFRAVDQHDANRDSLLPEFGGEPGHRPAVVNPFASASGFLKPSALRNFGKIIFSIFSASFCFYIFGLFLLPFGRPPFDFRCAKAARLAAFLASDVV